jgi:hypothetical protein
LESDIYGRQIGPTELAAVSLGNSFYFYSPVIRYWFSTAITPQQRLTGLIIEREEGYFIMDYFMHDFRFHFISDYIF